MSSRLIGGTDTAARVRQVVPFAPMLDAFTRQGPLVRSQYRPPNKIGHLRNRPTSHRVPYGSWYGRCQKLSGADFYGHAWRYRCRLWIIGPRQASRTPTADSALPQVATPRSTFHSEAGISRRPLNRVAHGRTPRRTGC